MSVTPVHVRGGLGNQVVQSFVGVALAAEQGFDKISFVCNCAVPESKPQIAYQLKNSYLDEIFFVQNQVTIDSNGIKKTRYWQHGTAWLITKHFSTIEKYLKLRFSKEDPIEAVVHIRSVDEKKVDDYFIYSKLVSLALAKHKSVLLIGDNQGLIDCLHLAYKDLGAFVLSPASALNDWKTLINADNIYCSPSAFAFSTKLVDLSKNIFVLNPLDYTSYQYAVNEYLFLSELKKFFNGVNFLDSFSVHYNSLVPETSFFNDIFPSSICWYLRSKEANRIANHRPNKPSTLASQILSSLPSDLTQLCTLNDPSDGTNLTFNKNFSESIKLYLESRIEKLNFQQSLSTQLHQVLSNTFLSAQKHIRTETYAPIIEESGLSVSRHFLFNLSYVLSRLEYINANLNSDYNHDLNQFLTNGYFIFPSLLPEEPYREVDRIFSERSGSLSKNSDTLIYNNYRNSRISQILLSSNFIDLLKVFTGYSERIIKEEIVNNTFLQTIELEAQQSGRDPQQTFHIDTFYPAFKFWYFPHKVELSSAPFEYVPKSHLPHISLMNYFHSRYKDNAYNTNYAISQDNIEGSLRATYNDIFKMGFKSIQMVVPANSLVIANVGGFHRRSLNRNHVIRHSVHSSIRPKDIFNPLTYSL